MLIAVIVARAPEADAATVPYHPFDLTSVGDARAADPIETWPGLTGLLNRLFAGRILGPI